MIEYTVKVYADGSKEWWLNGKRHREDGPAVEHADGYKSWWLKGKRHREDGPAVEYADGDKYMTEEGHKAAMNPTVEMTVEEICKALGKNVKVIK
jgi:hypothetical protein